MQTQCSLIMCWKLRVCRLAVTVQKHPVLHEFCLIPVFLVSGALSLLRSSMHCCKPVLSACTQLNTWLYDSCPAGQGCFESVITNPAEFCSGTLRVRPYHAGPNPPAPHGCPFCPANLCKGQVRHSSHNTTKPAVNHKAGIMYSE